MRGRRVAMALAVLLAGLAGAAGAWAQEDPVAGLVGQQVRVCSFALGGPITGRADVPVDVVVVDGVWLPGERSGALAVIVEAFNAGRDPASLAFTLRLQDAAGRRYDPRAGAVPAPVRLAIEDAFGARPEAAALQPSVPERRYLTFTLPLDAQGLRLLASRPCLVR